MNRNPKTPRATRPLKLLLLGLIPVGLGLFFVFEQSTARGGRGDEVRPRLLPEAADGARTERPSEELIPAPSLAQTSSLRGGTTTVLWPLEVDLQLRAAAYLPEEQGMSRIGSGASARLTGRIQDRQDKGARAQVRFVAGSNEGRVLTTDHDGKFGATNLYPGLSIVEVSGEGLSGARREVRLRQGKEEQLNISYFRPAIVVGRVQNRQGEAIPGARVVIDGTPVTTTLEGYFSLANVASGKLLMEVSHPDYAATQALVWVAAAQTTPEGRLVFTLQKGCELDVVVSNDLGGPGPVQLFFLPGQSQQTANPSAAYREERFPYHGLNPVELRPGKPHRITGLPSGSMRVYAYRAGAVSIMRFVNLRPDNPATLKVQLKPAETLLGTVTRDGEPAIGVPVVLEAPDRVRALLSHVREGSRFLEIAVLPTFPPARQATKTDANGGFRFTSWEQDSATRYLEARSARGDAWAGQLVRAGDRQVELVLEDASFGNSELSIEFPDRFQGLPVAVRIDGSPLDPILLPPAEELTLSELLAGEWSVRVKWHAQDVYDEVLTLSGATTRRRIPLPPECIQGQDEESWVRAGREYPLGVE